MKRRGFIHNTHNIFPAKPKALELESKASVRFAYIVIAGSVEDSAEKVEGPGTRDATESVNDSRAEESSQPPDVAATLSGLLSGLPSFAGSQRLASSLRQKFVNNSGESDPLLYLTY